MKIGNRLVIEGSNSIIHHYIKCGNHITFSLFGGLFLYKSQGSVAYLSFRKVKIYKRCGKSISIIGFYFGGKGFLA